MPLNRLLIIDDSPEDRDWLVDLAQANGYATEAFEQGEDGIRHFRNFGADCVLLDYWLNGMTGMSVLSELRAVRPATPIILLTGQGGEDIAATTLGAGAELYIEKGGLTDVGFAYAVSEAIGRSQGHRVEPETRLTRVLLVDDNDDDREWIESLLHDMSDDITVSAVETGQEALEHFKTVGTDCVILDYRLETEDGFDVLSTMKQVSPHTPVLMLTGQGSEEVAVRAIRAGATDYLVKTYLSDHYLQKAVENAVRHAALEIKVAEQAAERRRFLQILVEDLRAPLRNVGKVSEMIASELRAGLEPSEIRSLIESQINVTTRVTTLLDTLEDFALLDNDRPLGPVDLSLAADEALQTLAGLIDARNAEVKIGDLPLVQGNQALLTQLFLNLIDNGLKFNNDATPRVDVTTESETDTFAIIRVTDNGIGILDEHLKTIFEPLKRIWTSSGREGVGLGLAICQKIAERHQGTISCSSSPGGGSTFHIRLPKPLPGA